MSIVIAVKYKDGVALAADKQITCNGIKVDNATKIYKSKYSNTALGTVGHLRDSDILATFGELIDYEDILSKRKIDKNYVITKVVEKIFDIMKKHDRLLTVEDGLKRTGSPQLFATEDSIFTIFQDGSVIEYDDYQAMGCGQDLVLGYLNTIKDLRTKTKEEITEILATAIKSSCKDDLGINDKIDYIFLNKEIEIIGKEDNNE